MDLLQVFHIFILTTRLSRVKKENGEVVLRDAAAVTAPYIILKKSIRHAAVRKYLYLLERLVAVAIAGLEFKRRTMAN